MSERIKILLTGFTPFGGEEINPAYEALKALPEQVEGAEIFRALLPTVFGSAAEVLEKEILKVHPDAVICVGQAGGRSGITVEKVAINYRDAAIADNEGNRPEDEPVLPEGPAAYFATIPVKKTAEAIQALGIPAFVSYSAGTYVCNDIFYSLLHMADSRYPGMKAGFIHVPYVPQQTVDKPAGTASMALSLITEALTAAVGAVAEEVRQTI